MTTPRDAAAALRFRVKAAERPFAAFTGDAGRAWLVDGDEPRGYIETNGSTTEYTDLAQWQAEAERLGITTPEATAPPEQQTPEQQTPDQPAVEPPAEGAPPGEPAPQAAPPADDGVEIDDDEDDGTEFADDDNAPGETVLAPDLITGDPGGQHVPDDYDEEEDLEDDAEASPGPEPQPGVMLELPDLATMQAEQMSEAINAPPVDAPPAEGDDAEGKAPKVAVGSWVSWGSNVGRVDLIVTDGTVPGVDGDVTGSKDKPAARIQVWKGGKFDGRVGAAVSTLKGTFPRSQKKAGETMDVILAAAQAAGIDAAAVRSAYERGVRSWPGHEKTLLTAAGWGLGRADRLVKAAQDPDLACRDRDLLTKAAS